MLASKPTRPGEVDLQFIVRAFSKKHAARKSLSLFFKENYPKIIQKFVRVRKSVKNYICSDVWGG